MALSKEEKKLLKLAKKMKKANDKWLAEMTEIDEKMRNLSIKTSLRYFLERDYFNKMPSTINQIAYLQRFSGVLVDLLQEDKDEKRKEAHG
jgi:hypothetical protein